MLSCFCQMDNMKENVLSFLPSWLKKFPLHFHLLWSTNNCWITEFEQKYKTAYADYKEHLMKTAMRRNLEILRRKIIVFPFCKASIHWHVCWITFANTDRRNYCQIRKSNGSEQGILLHDACFNADWAAKNHDRLFIWIASWMVCVIWSNCRIPTHRRRCIRRSFRNAWLAWT